MLLNKNTLAATYLFLMLMALPGKEIHASPQTDWHDHAETSIYNPVGEKIALMKHSANCKHPEKTENTNPGNTNHCTHVIQLHPSNKAAAYPTTHAFFNLLHEQSFVNVTIEETDGVFHVQLQDSALSREYHLHSDTLPELSGNFNTTDNRIKLIATHPGMLTNFQYQHSYFQPVWWALSWVNLSPVWWFFSKVGLMSSPCEEVFTSSQDDISAMTAINPEEDNQWLNLKTEDYYAIAIQTAGDKEVAIYIDDPFTAYGMRKTLDTAKLIVNPFDILGLVSHTTEALSFSLKTVRNLKVGEVCEAIKNAGFVLHNSFETAIHISHIDTITIPMPGFINKFPLTGKTILECMCAGFVIGEYRDSSGTLYHRVVFSIGIIPPGFHVIQNSIIGLLDSSTPFERVDQGIPEHSEHGEL